MYFLAVVIGSNELVRDNRQLPVIIQLDKYLISFTRLNMNTEDMIAFVKAIADADRLRIIGFLTQRSARLSEMIERLGFPPAEMQRHLNILLQSGVIHLMDGLYEFDTAALEKSSRLQFEFARPSFSPRADLGENTGRVLSAHLNPDGTIKTVPLQPAKRQIILEYLLKAFTVGTNYTEKEVNMILKQFHPDTAALRRYLIDASMLNRERDGSRYWRPK
jgi:hypothetical protein